MIVREFNAKVVDNFATKWFEAAAANEDITVDEAKGYYEGDDFQEFADRISGKVVTITENKYPTGNGDYFEKIDNNFVMEPELFQEI
jgi:hypothetical protein